MRATQVGRAFRIDGFESAKLQVEEPSWIGADVNGLAFDHDHGDRTSENRFEVSSEKRTHVESMERKSTSEGRG